MVVGGAAAGVAGVLIGIPVLRLRGDYLAIVTLAFGEIIKNVLNCLYYLGMDGARHPCYAEAFLNPEPAPVAKLMVNGPMGVTRHCTKSPPSPWALC